jgi:hypothetical protein
MQRGQREACSVINVKNLLPWISIIVFDRAANLGSLYVVALMV